ncbi:formylglycine-generating enzyme family protein [Bacteroidota bacterium]
MCRFSILFLIAITLFSCKNSEKKKKIVVHDTITGTAVQKPVKSDKQEHEIKAEDIELKNMIYFEGGEHIIGSNDRTPDESPAFKKTVESFYLDKNLVTVEEFRKFIKETGYITDAEKYGDSGVFSLESQNWSLVKGATWEFPLGPDKPKAKDNHPVTQVSWNDATAYAKWAGKRLPTEFEWEYAAKNGRNTNTKYSWGNEIFVNGKFMTNVWQGEINENQGADGFIFTSPVGFYGELASGLTDMGGNVWQWCANTYEPYPGNEMPYRIDENVKAIRGSSFMFDQAGDLSYTVTFRSKNTHDTSLFNTGFRCAKDAS